MWWGDITLEAVMENWLVAIDREGGMSEAEATLRGQHEITRMKGWQTILGVCCTRCMLYSVYAVLGVCCTQYWLMIMARRDRVGWLNVVFLRWWKSCIPERERWEMKIRTIWRIWSAMGNQEYDLPDRVPQDSYRRYFPLNWTSYLPYQGWSIDLHTKFSKSHFLMMITPISPNLSLSCAQLYHHLRTRS